MSAHAERATRPGLLLSLVFEAEFSGDPFPGEVGLILDDLEALYRIARWLDAPRDDRDSFLDRFAGMSDVEPGGPSIKTMLEAYRAARGQDTTWLGVQLEGRPLARFRGVEPSRVLGLRVLAGWLRGLPRTSRVGSRLADEASVLHDELTERHRQRKRDLALSPEDFERVWSNDDLPRVRQLHLASPLVVELLLPASGSVVIWYVRALEKYFNVRERIKTERVDLLAKQAEREADSEEARYRAEMARRKLDELQAEPRPFRLAEGELRYDDGDAA